MVTLGAMVGVLALAAPTWADEQPAHVTIDVINCQEALNVAPTITIHRYYTPSDQSSRPLASLVAGEDLAKGVYRATVDVPPGNYTFSVADGQCEMAGDHDLTTFEGQDRHLVAVMESKYVVLRTMTNSSIGVFSEGGMVVHLAAQDKGDWLLLGVRDGSVTYFDDLRPGSYLLEVITGGTRSCAAITVPDRKDFGYRRFIKLDLAEMAPYVRETSAQKNSNKCGKPQAFVPEQ